MGGITISTGQLIAVIVFGAGTISALLKLIQSQYEKQNAKTEQSWIDRFKEVSALWDKRIADQQAAHELRVKEMLDSHRTMTDRYEGRIKWLEDRDSGWRTQQATYISTLEKAVDVQQRQQEAMDALVKKITRDEKPARAEARRRAGSDP